MRAFKPTPATLMAFLALIFAMAGTGIAAKSYVISSSSQIKDGVITGQDIKKSTITGTNVKDRSLSAADFSGNLTGPQGVAGPQGAAGPQGPAGPAGKDGYDGLSAVLTEEQELFWNTTSRNFHLGSIKLPAGTWFIQSTVMLGNSSSEAQRINCKLTSGAMLASLGPIGEAALGLPESAMSSVDVMGVAPLVMDGTVDLDCYAVGASGPPSPVPEPGWGAEDFRIYALWLDAAIPASTFWGTPARSRLKLR